MMKNFFGALVGLGIGIVVTLIIVTLVNIRVTQVDTSPMLHQMQKNSKINKTVLREIRSCVKPTGDCYKDGIKRTSKAVSNIGQITVLASACAGNPKLMSLTVVDRAARIQKCVVAGLDRIRHGEN